jgi:23S rRNA-/tRNA-specific pseudouridylate synthase
VGDLRYGGEPVGSVEDVHLLGQRLFLHAFSLKVRHPATGQKIEIKCNPPDSFDRCRG